MESYDISVVVLTYNPIKEKLLNTLDSIIMQQDINIQIILADDGSKNNLFNIAKDFLNSNQFYNYKMISSIKNQGTVKNVIQGVNACEAPLIKLISPGDCIIGTNSLANWVQNMSIARNQWSFCDVVCYHKDLDNHIKIVSKLSHPSIIVPYLTNNVKQCRLNYLINDDIVVGAATLCRRNILIKYLNQIDNHVKYAEDNIYRIMMFDGIVPYYHPENLLLYEIGSGISTTNSNIWEERISNDWECTNQIILDKQKDSDGFQKKLIKALQIKKCSFLQRILCPLYFFARLSFKHYSRKGCRYTIDKFDISLKY